VTWGSSLALVFCAVATGQTRPSATEPASVAATLSAAAREGTRVGADRCRACHKAEFGQFAKTRHATVSTDHGESSDHRASMDCETCHGPGKPHVDAEEAAHGDDAKTAAGSKLIFAFRANPKLNSDRCQTCHQSSRDQAQFGHSAHANHGVSCNDCHATHLVSATPAPARPQAAFFSLPKLPEENRWLEGSLLKKPQPELCYGCHGNIQAQFTLPTHHRVPEGAMKCTDCHNPHGTSNRATLRQAGWETCVQCHVEKRGPFVFEHSAVKVEGCVACHTPHGSVNRMLLVRREERLLCLSCHVNPNAVNVPHSRLSFQTRGDCSRCHASIHGSNFDGNFLH
jgi:predicted CXXCH cytochrome family protein